MVRMVRVGSAVLVGAALFALMSAIAFAAGTPPAAVNPTLAAAASPAAPSASGSPRTLRDYSAAPTGPIEENTSVQGKPDTSLAGVWLLVARPEIVPGKFRNFPQIFKITQGTDGPKFQLLDVKLPEDVQQSVSDANRKLAVWAPTPEMLRELKQNWSTLPVLKEKSIEEFLYGKLTYLVVAPDQYAAAFGGTLNDDMKKLLDGSKVAFKVEEAYRPRDLGPDSRIAQMISRTTVYAVKSADADTISGTQTMALIAAGSSAPIPYAFHGPFTMYRLA